MTNPRPILLGASSLGNGIGTSTFSSLGPKTMEGKVDRTNNSSDCERTI